MKGIAEGFQQWTGTEAANMCAANTFEAAVAAAAKVAAGDLPSENSAEKFTFDKFEYENMNQLGSPPPSVVEKWDPAGALTEFDDSAPVPWDMDNKFDDPNDILWGYVDRRCSMQLWDRARARLILGSANNMDVDRTNGQIYYVSQKLNGMIFHDQGQIAGVKVAEYFMDYAYEEIWEGLIGKAQRQLFGPDAQAYFQAERDTNAFIREERLKAAQQGKPLTKAEWNDMYKRKFRDNLKDVLKQAQIEDSKGIGARISKVTGAISVLDRPVGWLSNKISSAFDSIIGRFSSAYKENAKFGRIPNVKTEIDGSTRRMLPAEAKQVKRVNYSTSMKHGTLLYAKALGKIAGRLAATLGRILARLLAAFDFVCVMARAIFYATFGAIPITGPALAEGLTTAVCMAGFLISLALITVVPVVLADRADLDEDPTGAECGQQDPKNPYQGCPDSHPFNIICAMRKAVGPALTEFFLALPYIGDGIYAFGPYLCANNAGTELIFRQSFRPPPYYFDTTLSLYFTDKPRLLDGGASNVGREKAYDDPSYFKIKNIDSDASSNSPGYLISDLHPWVDFAHEEMLDKMADFYYGMSRKNQTINFDGQAEFEYITCFKGCIASSQMSCDVQVELSKITYDPITNTKISDEKIPNPCETIVELVDTGGCSYHDRRFYFTVDFTKLEEEYPSLGAKFRNADGTLKPQAEITRAGYDELNKEPDSFKRMRAYRRMFVVVGATNVNGTAPDVVDLSPDGEFIGEPPVALGTIDEPFLPPITLEEEKDIKNISNLYTTNLNSRVPTQEACAATSNALRNNGLKNITMPKPTDPSKPVGIAGEIVPGHPKDFTPMLSMSFDGENRYYDESKPDRMTPIPVRMPAKNALLSGDYTVSNKAALDARTGMQLYDVVWVTGGTLTDTNDDTTWIYYDKEWVDATTYAFGTFVFTSMADMCARRRLTDRMLAAVMPVGANANDITIYRYTQSTSTWAPDTSKSGETPQILVRDAATLETIKSSQPQNGTYAKLTVGQTTTYYMYKIRTTIRSGITFTLSEQWELVKPYRDGKTYVIKQLGNAYKWVRFSPMPRWGTAPIFGKSTKYWRAIPVEPRTSKERIAGGFQAGITAFLPLGFGFTGGAVATALDATGAGNKLACLYMDPMKNYGDYVLNGFIVSSQERFFIIKGPAILFAPGYVPKYSDNKCSRIPISSKICANRRNIRLLMKTYAGAYTNSRIKNLSAIFPNPGDPNSDTAEGRVDSCIYVGQSVSTSSSDRQDIPNTERNVAFQVRYGVADKDLCTQSIQAVKPISPELIDLNPLPTDSTTFMPPLTDTQRNALVDMSEENKRKLFLRTGCLEADYLDCSKRAIKEQLRTEFNEAFQKVDSDKSQGYYVEIKNETDMTNAKTPDRSSVRSGQENVCIYKTTVTVNRTETPATETLNIKFTLTPNTDAGKQCLYSIKNTDFPRKYFFQSLPRNGVLELPPYLPPSVSILRTTCMPKQGATDADKAPYSDCSGAPILRALLEQFNTSNSSRKILRVLKASTVQLEQGTKACDYEVNMMRKIGANLTIERETVRLSLAEETDTTKDPTQCLYRYSNDASVSARRTGTSIDMNSYIQEVQGEYNWPSMFLSRMRNTVNDVLKSFVQYDMPATVKATTADVKGKLRVLKNSVGANIGIQGCDNPSQIDRVLTCKSPEVVNAFIQRYGYDTWPAYPGSQFGTTKTSVVDVRRAGAAGPTTCHIELIEKVESFENFMKEPKPGTEYEFLNKQFFLRQYSFSVLNGAVVNRKCNFTVPIFSADDIRNRTFDISGEAYGIDTDSSTEFRPDQKIGISFNQKMISPWSLDVLRQIRERVSAYRYGPRTQNFVSMRLTEIVAAASPRPNVVEYRAFVSETFTDIDFGRAVYDGEYVIISATWAEGLWNPIAGAFTTSDGKPPAPSEFRVINMRRSEVRATGDTFVVDSDGVTYENPPYLYLDVEVDQAKEISRVSYPLPGKPTSVLTVRVDGTFTVAEAKGLAPAPFAGR